VKQDETALVKQAVEHARAALQRAGRVLPAAYMLVTRNPQTGAALMNPTAIGTELDEPLADQAAYDEFLGTIRQEAQRLSARAVVLAGEAEAEIEEAGRVVPRRVFFARVEDQDGVHHLHALIEGAPDGTWQLGELSLTDGASDDVGGALLAR
jgi:hypothetical protein